MSEERERMLLRSSGMNKEILSRLDDSTIEELDSFQDLLAIRKHGTLGSVIVNGSVNPPRLEISLSARVTDEEFHKAVSDLRRAINAIRSMDGMNRISDH